MRVLIHGNGLDSRFAGHFVYNEALRQGLDVHFVGSRQRPELVLPKIVEIEPDWVLSFVIQSRARNIYNEIKKYCRLAFWYPDQCERARDNMWRSFLRGTANLVFFSILHTTEQYGDLFEKVLFIPQYIDYNNIKPLPPRLDPNKEIYDIGFLGSVDVNRKEYLDRLSREFKVFRSGINTHREKKMSEVYAQCKMSVNIQRRMFLNPGNYITSNRIYNVLGCGCFYISHYIKKLDLLFKEGYHLVTFNDTYEDLRNKVKYYLEHDEERERIAKQGQIEVLKKHTLEIRVRQYWQAMMEFDLENGIENRAPIPLIDGIGRPII